MAYDRQQLRVDWIFRIDDTEEVAITGLSISGGTGFNAVEALADIDISSVGSYCINQMAALLEPAPIAWADYSYLTDLKIAALDVNGHYLTDAKVYTPTTPPHGDLTQIVPQSSVVVSLRSPTTLGRANYGRMYLPHCLLPLASTRPWAGSATTEAAVADAATFLNNINDTFNAGDNPGVIQIMSQKAPGISRAVTRVAIGSINDTQRRRRNRLQEAYSFAAVSS